MILLEGVGLRISTLWDDSCCVRDDEPERDGSPGLRVCGRPVVKRWLVLSGQPVWRVRLKSYCPMHAHRNPSSGLADPEAVDLTEDELTVLRVMLS